MAKIAVIGDVHGNMPALEAVLSQCDGCDAVWCVGDTVGYGPYPNECVSKVRGLGAIAVAGNHDLGSLGKIDLLSFNEYARRVCEWTGGVLQGDARDYLDSLPLRKRATNDVLLVHGSPRDPVWEYVLNMGQALEVFGSFDERICFHGHSHSPLVFASVAGETGEGAEPASEPAVPGDRYRLELESGRRYLVNVGSVGQPRDGDPRASYVLFDQDEGIITYRRAPYPVAKVQAKMEEEGLPEFLARRLADGY
ncbi:MAG: metallophosphatase family protein [Actinobacteria bacterium]|nr:metallophosphatase family protein [Actinomycetota bacterium]MCG2818454.1 metallophosphatase family protein [Actinomycetes bacterium]MBU4218569.1 metallophosphatase family protein [Actinomycetota bacterium]MBU4391581.1 metallophosphatase family protein [Actinomycetota bacterium]MBU4401334.1 metallophosphatase family protein [Actinomycetota bacterium]